LQALCGVLCSPIPEVELAGLDCLAALVSGNETVGAAILATTYLGKSLVSQVSAYLSSYVEGRAFVLF